MKRVADGFLDEAPPYRMLAMEETSVLDNYPLEMITQILFQGIKAENKGINFKREFIPSDQLKIKEFTSFVNVCKAWKTCAIWAAIEFANTGTYGFNFLRTILINEPLAKPQKSTRHLYEFQGFPLQDRQLENIYAHYNEVFLQMARNYHNLVNPTIYPPAVDAASLNTTNCLKKPTLLEFVQEYGILVKGYEDSEDFERDLQMALAENMPNLTSLCLGKTDEEKALQFFNSCPDIESLILRNYDTKYSDAFYQKINSLEKLASLTLKCDNTNLPHVKEKFIHLTKLDIHMINHTKAIFDTGLEREIPSFRSLNISFQNFIPSFTLGVYSNLEKLLLGSIKINDFNWILSYPKLKKLTLHNNDIEDFHLLQSHSCFEQLEKLVIKFNNVTEIGITALACTRKKPLCLRIGTEGDDTSPWIQQLNVCFSHIDLKYLPY